MATPIERAEAAQVAFGVVLMSSEPNRKKLAEALISVLSTAEMASKDTGGIKVQHGHQNIRDRNPTLWVSLEG